jgi:adenosylcobinamide kinase/adenosylcobinamide-phosphate guanylyltransferase
MNNLTLITGGARSGKSLIAESVAEESGLPVIYIATLQRWDDDAEGVKRIEKHQQRRPESWKTIERSFDLANAVSVIPVGSTCVVVDCLSVYVSNILLEDLGDDEDPYRREEIVLHEAGDLLERIRERNDLNFIVVTNEVGYGVVPENRLARAYRDMLGAVNQLFAGQADRVWLSVCGLRMRIKPGLS